MPVCRLLPYAVADGAHNMAADEVLLETAAAGTASLRFYGWSGPTVSLGYFQSHRSRLEDERLVALPFVRRPSGGLTLVHHHEVTYALALPAGPPWHGEEPWLRRMHRLIAMALAELGVAARLYEPAGEHFAGLLCFAHLTPGDLLVGAAKVVGSAQRKHRGSLMQHGSILLAQSRHTPLLPGIRELSGRPLETAPTCDAVARAFAAGTGWEVVPGEWTAQERGLVEQLAAEKYASAAWNKKR